MRTSRRLLYSTVPALLLLAPGCIIEGNRDPTTQTRIVPEFDRAHVDNGLELLLEIDPRVSGDVPLAVSAESNLVQHIETDVYGDTLVVDVIRSVHSHLPMRVSATVADLEAVAAHNGARGEVVGLFREDFSIDVDNGADLHARGQVGEVVLSVDNGADADARELVAVTGLVALNNGASATVCASQAVWGHVDNGATLTVLCGGDTSGVATHNGGLVQ